MLRYCGRYYIINFNYNGSHTLRKKSLSKCISEAYYSSQIKYEEDSNNKKRRNALGIQMLPKQLYETVFKNIPKGSETKDHSRSIHLLQTQGLLGKKVETLQDVHIKIPTIKSHNLIDHYKNIGQKYSASYKNLLKELNSKKLPPVPHNWLLQKGWTRYSPGGTAVAVSHPECAALVFDIEVCVSEGSDPTLACAASNNFWYLWCSDSLIEGKNMYKSNKHTDRLIPFGDRVSLNSERVIVGHHVSFDRAAIKEMYYLEQDKTRFVDTMSLHIAVSGFVEEQRNAYKALHGLNLDSSKPWMSAGCPNSLKSLYSFYCKEELKKESRDMFVKGTLKEIQQNFNELASYCAHDVKATHEVLGKLLPIFMAQCPHPATFAGMLEMGSTYLPVTQNWEKYICSAEEEFTKEGKDLSQKLIDLTMETLDLRIDEKYKENLWLWNLEWNVPKGKVKKLSGYPAWYRKLCAAEKGDHVTPISMSTSLHIVPKLLRLSWKGYPLHHEKHLGWGYLMPTISLDTDLTTLEDKHPEFPYEVFMNFIKENMTKKSKRDESSVQKPLSIDIPYVQFFRLPHKDGNDKNVGNPLAKTYLRFLEDGTMRGSAHDGVDLLLKANKRISYWKNNRDRIRSQIVTWFQPEELSHTILNSDDHKKSLKLGCILPQVVTAGTVTRRAVERTWMTASNPYEDRIGSELKSFIEAPPGYHFVGADVDSQELWIASVLGDAFFHGEHGATPVGWMTLMGNKADGTDMHSYTAKTSGISRNNAKIINYGRIYGAGVRFIERLLKEFNSNMTDRECRTKAVNLLAKTKGRKSWLLNDYGRALVQKYDLGHPNDAFCDKMIRNIIRSAYKDDTLLDKSDIIASGPIWGGGSESAMFNRLEEIATQDQPKTPVLGASISRTLEPWAVGGDYMTSRINWVVQSSAVDFLHLMLVTMRWLFDTYDIKGRFSISIHDEVRYLVASEDRYRAALALHITNLLTRSFIAMRLGLTDLPQSVAFFSGVDIDKVIRKEPNDDCITPSNKEGMTKQYGILPGECLDIYQVIEKTSGSLEKPM